MGEHTPTPWTANPDGWQPWQGAIQIVGADGYVVAYTATGGPEKENADLLCKVASSHDALVKALENASIQCGNVIFNCEQRPADNEKHLRSWHAVKEYIDAVLASGAA